MSGINKKALSKLNNYPGNKNINGLDQMIVSKVPKFKNYFEPFCGSAVIGRKLYASAGEGVIHLSDLNEVIIGELVNYFGPSSNIRLDCRCALEQLEYIKRNFNNESTVVYLDPPYTFNSRRSSRTIYLYEMTDEDHLRLLSFITNPDIKFRIIISHYYSELYKNSLDRWCVFSMEVSTRRGIVTEYVYTNFNPGILELYVYEGIGDGFVDRQRIKRQNSNIIKKINRLPLHEKMYMLEQIKSNFFE